MPATRAPSAVTATRLVKSRDDAALLLDDLDAAVGGDQRRVDVVDGLVGVALERAVQRRDREQPRVVVGELAVHLDRRACGRRGPASSIAKRPSFAASGMYGPSTSRSSAPTVGMLTAFVTSPPSSAAATCSATITPARSCASSVDAARCGVTTTFGAAAAARRTAPATKTSSAAPATLPDSSAAISAALVDQLAAGGVDDPDAVAHLRDRLRVDRAARVVGQRQVQGQEVGAREDLVERRALDPQLAEPLGGDERVVRDDLHLQTERAPRHLPADAAEAEHAEHLVRELDTAPLRALPAALDQRRVGLRDVARQREQQPDRVLGRRDDIRLGRVRDDDAAPGRRVDVDVVDSDAGAPDHLEARRRGRSRRPSASSPSG